MAVMRELLGAERREVILRRLQTDGKVRAARLSEELGVSLDTVRRDLAELAAAGLVRRGHGGALPPASPGPSSFKERLPDDVDAKGAIAAAAVALIRPGDVVAVSAGKPFPVWTDNSSAAGGDGDAFVISASGGGTTTPPNNTPNPTPTTTPTS